MPSSSLIALDVGTVRIGVAFAESSVPIAIPLEAVNVDGTEIAKIQQIVDDKQPEKIIIGYPRNQQGEPTKQTEFVEEFCKQLVQYHDKIVFQDESLTSVKAEENLKQSNRPYQKADIDKLAAAIILQDYLETYHA